MSRTNDMFLKLSNTTGFYVTQFIYKMTTGKVYEMKLIFVRLCQKEYLPFGFHFLFSPPFFRAWHELIIDWGQRMHEMRRPWGCGKHRNRVIVDKTVRIFQLLTFYFMVMCNTGSVQKHISTSFITIIVGF